MPLFSKVKDIFKGGGASKKKKVYHNVKLENPDEIWEVQCELGDGAYGKVYKCTHKENGTLAALKQVQLEAEEDLETFMIEIDILTEFKHENVVGLLEAYHYDGKLWMYLEYCDGGAMDSIMVDLDRPLNERQIAYVTKNLCNALIYIHENKVIHRDLKAGNVLLTMEGGIKLADFGVSAKNKNTYDKRGTFIGTPYWLAPEVILCETFIDAKYDYKADIWSLGISLIEFAQMDPPNHEVSPVRVMLKIQKSEPPKLDQPARFSKEFNDFIAKCLVKDPNQRPTAAELLKHPFINRDISAKPIRDLLLEYRAEVVEIEEDVDDEDRISHRSIDSDMSTRHDDSTQPPNTPSQEKQEAEKNRINIEKATKDEKEVPSGPAIVDGNDVVSSEAGESVAAGNASDAVEKEVSREAPGEAAVADTVLMDATQTPQKEIPSSPISSPTLSEAEEQAVRMLDSAIDSAVSGGVENSSVDERDEADNSAIMQNDVDAITTQHEDLVKDIDSVTEETDIDSPEKVGHKLDESEVVISNSSILHDNEEPENEPQIKARYELTLEDLDNSTQPPSKVDTSLDTANISVVAVDIPNSPVAASGENKLNTIVHSDSDNQVNLETSSNISNISNLSSGTQKSTERSVSSGEEDVRPVSVTIAGTTLSHTDVDDDVFDQTENQQTKHDEEISYEFVQQSKENALPNLIQNDTEMSRDLVQLKRENSVPNQKPALVRDITIESNVSVDVRVPSPTSISSAKVSDSSSPTTPLTPISPTIITTPNNLPNGIGKDARKISDATKNEQNEIDTFEVVTLRNPDAVRKPTSHAVERKIQSKNEDKENLNKEEKESIALRKKTRKRTRKFVIDGVVVTTTTSKVIYGDDEELGPGNAAHLARKQELRELKVLQKQEQKQFQELGVKANFAKLEQEKKFEAEKQQLLRGYDTEVEGLNRQQKQQVEKAEASQEMELKLSSKRIRTEQEKELKSFREALRTELKLLKQEIDLLPKEKRKEALKVRKERLENDQSEREKAFLEKLHETHELSLKRLGDDHRERIALLERQFLQQKHQLLRSRESALWEMEERHLHEKHQLAKRQLKDIFFLQRHQMLLRHEKELEQVKRMNEQKEDELVKRQLVERRALPKRIRQEMKAREMMYRESMRISTSHLPDSHEDEKDKLKKFQDGEKKRYEAEKKRAEQKHKRQLEELQAASESTSKELEQLQNEKRKMLMEHETYKLRCQDEEYQRELREWKANLKPRKQKLEEEFEKQLVEQEQFYGAYLSRGLGSSMAPSQSTTSLRSSTTSYREN